MKIVSGNRLKTAAVAAVAIVLLCFVKAWAEVNAPQASSPGKYQAVYVGQEQVGSGHRHVILVLDTQTGKLDKSIMYEDGIHKQEIIDFTNNEVVKIKLGEKEEHSKIVR